MDIQGQSWPWGQARDAVMQSVFVTEDIDGDMARYAFDLKIGPWFIRRDFGFDTVIYRGSRCEIPIDLAIAFSGTMMIELIQQKNDAPSPYRELVEQHGYGFHHWAFGARPDCYQVRLAEFENNGFTPLLDLDVTVGGRTALFDPGEGYGGMIELIEVMPHVELLFEGIHAASVNWDGSDPIRPF